jgi:hypothetical protein
MKLRGAAKAKFLARMAAGRRKVARQRRAGNPIGPFHDGPASWRALDARQPLVLMVPTPTKSRRRGRTKLRRITAKRRREHMARLGRNSKGQFVKRRRNPSGTVVNPRRRRRRNPRRGHHGYSRSYAAGYARAFAKPRKRRRSKARGRRVTHVYRKGSRARRAYPFVVKFNRPKRRRRARNPSFGGVMRTVKSTLGPMFMGGLSGFGAGVLDAKLLGNRPLISILSKLGLAVVGAGVIGRKHPLAAAGWAGGLIGATGYTQGVKLGGGLVGLNNAHTVQGLAELASDDPEMAALLAGLGDVVDEGRQLGDAADYEDALAGEDDGDMSDLVEAEAA